MTADEDSTCCHCCSSKQGCTIASRNPKGFNDPNDERGSAEIESRSLEGSGARQVPVVNLAHVLLTSFRHYVALVL